MLHASKVHVESISPGGMHGENPTSSRKHDLKRYLLCADDDWDSWLMIPNWMLHELIWHRRYQMTHDQNLWWQGCQWHKCQDSDHVLDVTAYSLSDDGATFYHTWGILRQNKSALFHGGGEEIEDFLFLFMRDRGQHIYVVSSKHDAKDTFFAL